MFIRVRTIVCLEDPDPAQYDAFLLSLSSLKKRCCNFQQINQLLYSYNVFDFAFFSYKWLSSFCGRGNHQYFLVLWSSFLVGPVYPSPKNNVFIM